MNVLLRDLDEIVHKHLRLRAATNGTSLTAEIKTALAWWVSNESDASIRLELEVARKTIAEYEDLIHQINALSEIGK